MAKVAMAYNIAQQGDGTVLVRDPKGTLLAQCPTLEAGAVLLGWMRLAAWAHARLSPAELAEVLGTPAPPPQGLVPTTESEQS